MQTDVIDPPTKLETNQADRQANPINYQEAEQQFVRLLELEDLDSKLAERPEIATNFATIVDRAIAIAYQDAPGDNNAAHRFLQRVLYRINRLNLFWYDDLRHYTNERSLYLRTIRDRIEQVWQQWELRHIDIASLQQIADVKQALIDRAKFDVDPPLNEDSHYIREQMAIAEYKHLLAIASFDGLVEASRLSRILGGAANEVQCTLVRVLLEEYGSGKLSRKHSTFFAQMLAELDLNTQPEAYFDIVPWEVLASINHNFLLTECKRYFLRYNGGLAYFEIVGPAIYKNYLAAAQRLQLSQAAMGYWELHIREDERHGRWMIDDVAIPLVDMYRDRAWEIVWGYDQEKFMSERAGVAVVRSLKQIHQTHILNQEAEAR